ncbi:M28 family peptidase [Nocardiopsis nanhaiensis]
MQQQTHPPGLRASALVALALIAALIAGAVITHRPPPEPATPTADAFDTQRAMDHLDEIAQEASPIGSAANDRNRDYLQRQLQELGLETEVHSAVGARAFGDQVVSGLAHNVVATVPGTDPTGQLVLAAHYDSTPTTPGASDDKMSVAVILEIARHLAEGAPPRNDIVLLLSDGEEPGLIGAEAFAEHHPATEQGGVLINLEGPGNSGPSVLYNTSADNAALVDLHASAAPHPAGESAMASVYELMPANSDFTTLTEHGFTGLEYGPLDGRVYYHHPRDTVEALDRDTLHQHGANTLALTRELVDTDLARSKADTSATYFTVAGTVVHYPGTLVWPLALIATLAVAALGLMSRLTGTATTPRLLAAAATGIVPLLGALGAGWALWQALTLIRPEYGDLLPADPSYRPELYRFAVLAVVVAVVWAWHLLARRWFGAQASAVGVLFWPALFGVAMAALAPGAAYVGTLPALAAALAGMAALAIGPARPRWRLAALATGIVPGAALAALTGYLFAAAVGMDMGTPIAALGFSMAAVLTLPLLEAALPGPGARARKRVLAPLTALATAAALAATGLVVDRYDDDHPRMAHLVHITDADTGTAQWASYNTAPSAWVQDYVSQEQTHEDSGLTVPRGVWFEQVGPAPDLQEPAPEIEVDEVRTQDGDTVMDLTLRSHRDAFALVLHLDRRITDGTLQVPDLPQSQLPALEPTDDTQDLPYEVHFYNPPEEGLAMTVHVEGTDRPELAVSDATLGLEDIPGFEPRPYDVDLAPSLGVIGSDTAVITRAHHW